MESTHQNSPSPAQKATQEASSQQFGGEMLEGLDGMGLSPAQAAANNSPQVKQLMAYQEMADSSPQVAQLKAVSSLVNSSPVVQRMKGSAQSSGAAVGNPNGLPAQLRSGIEALSGFDMGDVKVHYNSDQPAQFKAEAYAQGSDIHLASGMEQHLPHEAWHVAQQKAGRVAPTGSEGGQAINTDAGLEAEADAMGAKAMQMKADTGAGLGSAEAKGGLQFKRLSGGPKQFGKRRQRQAQNARRQALRANQEKIKAHYDTLKEMGRRNRQVLDIISGLDSESLMPTDEVDVSDVSSESGQDQVGNVPVGNAPVLDHKENPHLDHKHNEESVATNEPSEQSDQEEEERDVEKPFYKHWQLIRNDALKLKMIQQQAGLMNPDPDTCPAILSNAIEAVGKAQKAIRKKANALIPNVYDEIRAQQNDDDHTNAVDLLELAQDRVSMMDNDDEEISEDELKQGVVAAFKGGAMVRDVVIRALPLSEDEANEALGEFVTEKNVKALKTKYGKEKNENGIRVDLITEFATFRQSEAYTKHKKQYAQLAHEAVAKSVREAYHSDIVEYGVEGVFDTFRGMLRDNADVAPHELREDEVIKALKDKFNIPEKDLKDKDLEAVVTHLLSQRSDRIADLFMDTPGLLEQCLAKVKRQEIHQTLMDIKQNGKSHSIKDINDYVGDKLNEPLMRWVIEEGIGVEVHAMSTLASFAKLKSEGYTDIVEIPSDHTATKKWIAINPATEMAKVVFQTLPGESYAIQTAGAFLFYEIYDEIDEEVSEKPFSNLDNSETDENDKVFTHKGYKAVKLYEDDEDENVAIFLLAKEPEDDDEVEDVDAGKPDKHLLAHVPYKHNLPEIGSDGEIIIHDQRKGARVRVTRVEVHSMDASQLSMYREDTDYAAIYQDILRSYGVNKVDIACIGREGALVKELEEEGLEPYATIDHPYFKGRLFMIDGTEEVEVDDATETRDRTYTLLTLSISPDFFGDKSGKLMQALKQMGVQHVSFVGTAGGLNQDSKVGDLMAPKSLANFANGKDIGGAFDNKAQELIGKLHGKDGFDKGAFIQSDLHVGVHSPITESDEMIEKMKGEEVSSVDCEAGFVADALKGSGVSLYAFFFVGDVPGTHHSIGQGGVAGDLEEAQIDKTAPTEMAVMGMIKKAVGGEINASDRLLANLQYPFDRAGNVQGDLKFPDGRKARVKAQPLIPKSGADSRTAGIMKNFGIQLDAILQSSNGQITLKVQQDLQKLGDKFLNLYKIKFVITIS